MNIIVSCLCLIVACAIWLDPRIDALSAIATSAILVGLAIAILGKFEDELANFVGCFFVGIGIIGWIILVLSAIPATV